MYAIYAYIGASVMLTFVCSGKASTGQFSGFFAGHAGQLYRESMLRQCYSRFATQSILHICLSYLRSRPHYGAGFKHISYINIRICTGYCMLLCDRD